MGYLMPTAFTDRLLRVLCPRPITVPYRGAVPCGQCLPCRINRVRSWTARILLEAMTHEASIFVTLTYAPGKIPIGEWDPDSKSWVPDYGRMKKTLDPRDLTLFLKRLRERVPHRIRYFACGEYGEKSGRPHYHAVIFGLNALDCVTVKGSKYLVHPDVQAAWGLGFTSASELTPERGAYCAQYCTKKLTRPDDEWTRKQLDGRYPEFMRVSRRPGLGAERVRDMAEAILIADPSAEDVPTEFVYNGRTWPVPTYIAAKMREELGLPRLASDRPPRERKENELDELVEIVSWSGELGPMTRKITRREQKASEAENKATRAAKRRRESYDAI